MRIERMHADALLLAFEPPLRPDALLRMEINLHVSSGEQDSVLHLALRIGTDRLYVVQNISAFLQAYENGETMSFGKGLEFDPENMRFDPLDERILAILLEMEEARRTGEDFSPPRAVNSKFLPLGSHAAGRLLRLLMAKPYRLTLAGELQNCPPIACEHLPIDCALTDQEGTLTLSVHLPHVIHPVTPDYEFVMTEDRIIKTEPAQRRIIRALLPYAEQDTAEFGFPQYESERVVAEILPQLEMGAQVTLQKSLEERIVREKLQTRVYIDREEDQVAVRVAFIYGNTTIDPFAESNGKRSDNFLLVRDATSEFAVLETLAHAGFRVSAGKIHLSGNKRILQFILEGVQSLQKLAEVYASDAFKKLRPRRPQFTGKLSMNNGALEFTLFENDIPIENLAEIMQALRDHHQYFRLKDGSFLELSDLEEWDELADMLGDAPELRPMPSDADEPPMPAANTLHSYRAAYLVSLLSMLNLPIEIDEEARKAAASLNAEGDPCPQKLSASLRSYQMRGYAWMQALYRLRMGGVLADDMGLGKTLQVITTILWARELEGCQPSLVIAPTSLVYNWQAEITRFAPDLSCEIIEGGQRTRLAQWENLADACDTDVIITSYPLLRRDIETIRSMKFRFVVLDEAQHIKNPKSLAAEAASQVQAHTRLALTGTPMENNPGELWSIFNFVLPEYLAPLPQFMRKHGDGSGSDILSRRIRPFLLRRLKSEVLPELPDKIEYRVLADMPPEQKAVYAASAQQLRQRVERILGEKGLGRGRMEVLSAITQLRQICCHPQLVLDDYEGSSGKLDALLELLADALAGGRRVLLFSQFTSMLTILRRRLDADGIASLYLDGKTPVAHRLELVNRFNGGEGQVFLISLKAGGAGLNLTGADTVVHYDPWWNPAVEDQATDRAHRIGQRHVVQVIRLITRGTIEEQVAKLSEKKRALFDSVITAGEQLPSEMTEKEIMELFS